MWKYQAKYSSTYFPFLSFDFNASFYTTRNITGYLDLTGRLYKGNVCIKILLDLVVKNLEALMVKKTSSSGVTKFVSYNRHPSGVETRHFDIFCGSFQSNEDSKAKTALNIHHMINPALRTLITTMPVGFTQQSMHVSSAIVNWKSISVALLLECTLLVQCNRCNTQNVIDKLVPGIIHSINCCKCDKIFSAQFFGGNSLEVVLFFFFRVYSSKISQYLLPTSKGISNATLPGQLYFSN